MPGGVDPDADPDGPLRRDRAGGMPDGRGTVANRCRRRGCLGAAKLALLKQPAVMQDGGRISFGTSKAVTILALLAVTYREHSRKRFAALP